MTLICLVPGPGTQIPVGRVRIEAELSDKPRFYWQGHHDWRWFEADGLAEATARALGHRDLADVELPDDEPGNMTDIIMNNMDGIERHDARLLARTILAHGYRRPEAEPEDNECEGHESLRGDFMGATYYCDGSCVR